jgi:hypothetical protein
MLVLTILWAWNWNHGTLNFAVDLAIPLRAADRLLAGVSPYQAADFAASSDLPPFLYPPPVALLIAPLPVLPRLAVEVAWVAALFAAAIAALRTLGVPARAWPLALAWPPLLEPLFNGNVQVLLFAAFVAFFYRRTGEPRDLGDPATPAWRSALLATAIPFMKVAQPHAWLHILGRRPRAALAGALAVGAIALVTVVVLGPGTWQDWIEQTRRAADPAWRIGGFALARLVPPVGLVVTGVTFVAAFLYRGPRAGAVVGALTVVGAPSLYLSGVLMLVPALLLIRREVALVSAILIATSTYMGGWAGILLALGSLLGARWRPGWLEDPVAA